MRRAAALAAVLALLIVMSCPVSAATGASSVLVFATVSSDGSCQVTANITLHLEHVVEDLSYPVPLNAQNISVNGSSARTSQSGSVQKVDLSRVVGSVTGDFTVSVSYRLTNLVTLSEEGVPELNVPLLSGFAYPVEKLQFSVSLPGLIENRPVFISGYFQEDIEPKMTWETANNTVSGTIDMQLRDLETFTVSLAVTEEMFPGVIQEQWRSNIDNIAMWVLTGLAVLYWIFFLRCLPLRKARCTTAPEGFTAGQLGSILTGQGADLTLTVFTWANLGYILIYMDKHGNVTLHKRMDMGNERSAYEQKLFRRLFGKRRMVDGSSYRYAELCKIAAESSGNVRSLYRKKSGRPRIFRILCAGIGLFAGISLGSALSQNAVLAVLLSIIFAAACTAASWLIQDWVMGLHLNRKDKLLIALACGIAWIIMGIVAKEANIATAVVIGQFAAGLFAAYGGRRTDFGRQMASQVLGLRYYLCNASSKQVHKMTNQNSEYFFTMIPAAMALGCGELFAAQFGKRRLVGCPYLTTGMDGHRTAMEWYRLLKRAADSLDARQKRLLLERLTSK